MPKAQNGTPTYNNSIILKINADKKTIMSLGCKKITDMKKINK